ncbi:alpha/beta hydrolase [Shewanella gaetbuli]
MSALRIIAGETAYKQIESEGFRQQLFTQILAASGGPKWIGIAGLDKYLFGEFFKHREDPLYMLGASSGAWRLACLGQQNPLEAYDRLEHYYINQRYDTVPTREQVSEKVTYIVNGILGEQAGKDIIANPIFRNHIVACRAKHVNASQSKLGLAIGLALTAACNSMSRKSLHWHFERVMLSHQDAASPFGRLKDLPTKHKQLTENNIQQAMLATGSIPFVLAPVQQIHGLPEGKYYDGGITDYHFDLPLPIESGLTMYPHFYEHMSPGWFDKSLVWRKAKQNYHNALILAPSNDYIAKLPYSKLPDRTDFKQLDSDSRIQYWQKSVKQSQQLADELATIIDKGTIMEHMVRW